MLLAENIKHLKNYIVNKQQLDSIKRITKYDYSEIVVMNDMTFWKTVTICLARGSLSPAQHKYLDQQRTGHGLEQGVIDALQVFDGKLIR